MPCDRPASFATSARVVLLRPFFERHWIVASINCSLRRSFAKALGLSFSASVDN